MGRQVMMTGDGANDCISLLQLKHKLEFHLVNLMHLKGELNIFLRFIYLYSQNYIYQLYTAPFSSKSTSLKCCIQVLAQGKAAIMTIIEVFQYQLSVNGIKFAAVTIMFLEVQNFSEFQTVYVGFISNIPLLIFLCISSPATELAEYIPLDDQFSYQNQIQIYTNIFFAVLGLCINYGILITTDRFFEYSKPIEKFQREGYLNSLMFLSLMYYFMSFGVSIYVSNPFKVKYYKNILLTLWTTLGFVVAIVLSKLSIFQRFANNFEQIKQNFNLFKKLIFFNNVLNNFSKIGHQNLVSNQDYFTNKNKNMQKQIQIFKISLLFQQGKFLVQEGKIIYEN